MILHATANIKLVYVGTAFKTKSFGAYVIPIVPFSDGIFLMSPASKVNL